MDRDVSDSKQAEPRIDDRPQWRAPELAEYDIVSNTGITSGGYGGDSMGWLTTAS